MGGRKIPKVDFERDSKTKIPQKIVKRKFDLPARVVRE